MSEKLSKYPTSISSYSSDDRTYRLHGGEKAFAKAALNIARNSERRLENKKVSFMAAMAEGIDRSIFLPRKRNTLPIIGAAYMYADGRKSKKRQLENARNNASELKDLARQAIKNGYLDAADATKMQTLSQKLDAQIRPKSRITKYFTRPLYVGFETICQPIAGPENYLLSKAAQKISSAFPNKKQKNWDENKYRSASHHNFGYSSLNLSVDSLSSDSETSSINSRSKWD